MKPLKFLIFMLATLIAVACERDTKLKVTGGNPPVFEMTGSGRLTSIRVRGHKPQRNVFGEAVFLYWVIESNGNAQFVRSLRSVTYGKVPDGYRQKYPESGEAPVLEEGEHYYVRVVTSSANGDDRYFMILNGKVLFAKSPLELPAEVRGPK
jgi:hypothetical protein